MSWRTVTKADPCPICGKPDWCGRTDDGAVRCMRDAEPPAGWRLISDDGEGGRVFRNGQLAAPPRSIVTRKAAPAVIDRTPEARRCVEALTPALAGEIADALGVPVGVLDAIRVGWSVERDVWTFPERGPDGRVCGIVYRDRDGNKKVGVGHRRGLIVPVDLSDLPDPVVAVEGASDVLAALAMGLAVVGRPNNKALAKDLDELLRDRDVIVVGENDQKPDGSWPGRDGAKHVAGVLARAWGRPVPWALVPAGAKDLREYWINSTEDDPAEVGRRLLEALLASSEIEDPGAVTALTESEAGKLKREVFQVAEAHTASGIRLCTLLADFTDGGGFEALGLMHEDHYGRKHRTLGYFAGPWGLTTGHIRRMIGVGRLRKKMLRTRAHDLFTTEKAVMALLPLEDRPDDMATACRTVVEQATREAEERAEKSGGRARPRISAKLVRSVVTPMLPPKPQPSAALALRRLVRRAYDACAADPDAPADLLAHLESARQVALAWADREVRP